MSSEDEFMHEDDAILEEEEEEEMSEGESDIDELDDEARPKLKKGTKKAAKVKATGAVKKKAASLGGGGVKKKRGPDAPKRAMNAYTFFANDKRAAVRKAHPDMSVTEVGKELGKLWRKASDSDK